MTTEEIKKELEYILRVNDQPCGDYKVDPNSDAGYLGGDPFVHQCPRCFGWRAMCKNCASDHHKNGWVKCQITLLLRTINGENICLNCAREKLNGDCVSCQK